MNSHSAPLASLEAASACLAAESSKTEWDTLSFSPWLSILTRFKVVETSQTHDFERAMAEKLRTEDTAGATPTVQIPWDALSSDAHILLRHDGLRRLLGCTAHRFPHVVNRLAAAWFMPDEVVASLDSMLFSERLGRQGFPAEVVGELLQVRAHYEEYVAPILRKAHAQQQWEQAQQDAHREAQRRLREERVRARRQQAMQAGSTLRRLLRKLLDKRPTSL